MGTLAEAYVRLRPDTTGLGPAIEAGLVPAASAAGKKAGEAAGRETAGGFKSSIKTLAEGFAGLEIFDFLKESVNAGREAAASLRLTDAAIKSTGGAAGLTGKDVHELAEKLGELDGVQGDVVQSGENVLLTFTNIKNKSGAGNDIFNQATQSALNLSAAMHQDLQSSVVQLGKALNDPVKGVTALQRVGVTFTAQQKEQIASLVKHNQTLAAQKIILAEVNKEFGGAAAAATDPAQKAQVAWHDFQEELGTKLLPVLTQLLGFLTKILPTIESISSGVVDFIVHNKLLVEILGGVAVAVYAVNLAMSLNPITLIVGLLAGLTIALVYCWEHFAGFRNVVEAAWKDVKDVSLDVAHFFTKDIPAAFDETERIAEAAFGVVSDVVSKDLDDVHKAGTKVANFFTKDIPHAYDTVVDSTRDKFDQVRGWVVNKFDAIRDYVKAQPGKIVADFAHIGDDFEKVGENIVHGIVQGIKNVAGEVTDAAKNLASGALSGAKHLLGINSPSRVFADQVGAQIPAGIAAGIDANAGVALGSIASLTTTIIRPVPTPAAASAGSHGDLLDAMHRVGDLLAGLKLTVGPEGVALAARAGEKSLVYAGR